MAGQATLSAGWTLHLGPSAYAQWLAHTHPLIWEATGRGNIGGAPASTQMGPPTTSCSVSWNLLETCSCPASLDLWSGRLRFLYTQGPWDTQN